MKLPDEVVRQLKAAADLAGQTPEQFATDAILAHVERTVHNTTILIQHLERQLHAIATNAAAVAPPTDKSPVVLTKLTATLYHHRPLAWVFYVTGVCDANGPMLVEGFEKNRHHSMTVPAIVDAVFQNGATELLIDTDFKPTPWNNIMADTSSPTTPNE